MSADTPLVGAHVSTRGGIDKAVDNAVAIGAEVFQTHPTPAQTWAPLRLDAIRLRTSVGREPAPSRQLTSV